MRPDRDNVAPRRVFLCNRPVSRPAFHRLKLLASGILFLLLGCGAPDMPPFAEGVATLVVNLDGFHNDRGVALVSLFRGTKGFPDEVAASLATVAVAIRDGRATATFMVVPYGEYAVSVLHDEDENGEMATGLFGAPREGFGFSGHPGYRFGPPAFAEASFFLFEPQREMTIGVRYETGRRQHQQEGRAAESGRPPQE